MTDTVQRFHFSDSPVRGELTQLSDTLKAVLDRHAYPERISALLGEAMAASVLLTCSLKFEGSLIVHASGDGPLRTLMVECNHRRELRAIAQLAEDWNEQAAMLPLSQLFGNGQLAITLKPENGQQYQGIVPIDSDKLSDCIEHYFAHSEQLPTRLWLAASGDSAAGLMLQVLPGHDKGDDADIWPRLCRLTETITDHELLELPATELLYRLYHEETVELYDAAEVRFKCHCSRARTEQVLLALGEKELYSILEERGKIDVQCQFCNQEYCFDLIDVEQLLRGGAVSPPQLH